MDKGNKIVIGLLIFVIVGIITILVLNDKGIIHLCGELKCETDCPICEEKVSDSSETVFELNHYVLYSENFMVELSSNGFLRAYSKGSFGTILASNIVSAEQLTYGQHDICTNVIIAMIDKDGKLSAKDVSNTYCSNKDNFSSSDLKDITKLNTLNKKVLRVYNERKYVNEFEPYKYLIYAQFEDGSVEDITSYFE